MKKLILGLGVFALTFASLAPASALCSNPDGSVVDDGSDKVYARGNDDGTCSDCDYTCSMPILSPGW
jgi:predicted RNA methylase